MNIVFFFRVLSFRRTAVLGCWLIAFAANAQTSAEVGRSADSAYAAKNYKLAIEYYTMQAEMQPFPFMKKSILYNIACNFALAGDREKAWFALNESVAVGYNNYSHMLRDSDLEILHHDKEWKKIKARASEYKKRLSDPLKAKLVTTDIHNFWHAYDLVQKDNEHAKEIYSEHYFNKASPGLQDYFNSRIFSVDYFVGNQRVKPSFYKAIRNNTLKVDEFKDQIKDSFVRFKKLYDDAVFPDIYFLIGRWSSAGTVSGNGLLIGTDMLSKSDEIPTQELNLWEKNNYKSIDNLPYLVVHELIHSQQGNLKNDTTTLSASIREGMADFFAELVAGKTSNERLLEFGKGKEKQIWEAFEKDMYRDRAGNWIGNALQETPDHPADLGYWVGYQICKSYYQEMPDKKQAVYDILNIKDYKAFLAKSRYVEKLVVN
jgi:hypothetical protein